MKIRTLLSFLLFFSLLVWSAGCEKNENRTQGRTLQGTIYQVLDDRGGYDYFLRAVDAGGYRRLVDGGGLVTVFAPGDAAMSAYLERAYGTTDIGAIPASDLELLIGSHMIQFSYTNDDFLSFSVAASDDESSVGGSCYKYKSYGREPIADFIDPRSRRKVKIFSTEKYVPVFSSRIFAAHGVTDPEGSYRSLFPDVNWQGTDDQLYAGNAHIIENGVATDNGYLYIVDKVIEPYPTIYKTLEKPAMDRYSAFKALFDRINWYEYDATVTKNYSSTGDSLFYFYHWQKPVAAGEIPEIASEASYHNENGNVFDRALRYAVNCFAPSNTVLDAYLKEYFKEFGTYAAQDDYLSVIPNNALYHFLRAHVFGGQNIILPGELDNKPLIGINGERFTLSGGETDDIKYCSNGILYGMGKVFEPAVFTHLTAPLFQYPKYAFYSRAFNVLNMYQQTVDSNNGFTLFAVEDDDLLTLGYSSSESTSAFGDYSFRSSSGNMANAGVSSLLMSHFVYGNIENIADMNDVKYFVAKNGTTYFYVKNGTMYDYANNAFTVSERFPTQNGTVYQINKTIPARSGGFSQRYNRGDCNKFRTLMQNAGLGNASGGLVGTLQDAIVFFPTDAAIDAAQAAGYIPTEKADLAKYLNYYFVSLKLNKLSNFLLPGLGPGGSTNEAFSETCVTFSEYTYETDAKYLTISWDPQHNDVVTITDMAGNSITTTDYIELRSNCATYTIDACFDYRTMFGN